MFTKNKKISRETLQKAASAHRQSLINSLKHRLEVARASGDDNLVGQLEAEAKYLKISGLSAK
ncbi:MAG: hypothetical protein QNJ54_09285 [Prochloraceae cyanobacterium]|nr:hypothetical protein [Prochloraceae cyanobacterium]